MADLTRFWIVANGSSSASVPSSWAAAYRIELQRGAGARDGSARDHQRAAAPCIASSPDGGRTRANCAAELLDQLAQRHAGLDVRLDAPRELLAECFAHALGIAPPDGLERVRNLVLDWPTRADPQLRCAFIGLDLDWSPPPPARRAARFPGGPGSAASRRQ